MLLLEHDVTSTTETGDYESALAAKVHDCNDAVPHGVLFLARDIICKCGAAGSIDAHMLSQCHPSDSVFSHGIKVGSSLTR